MENCELIQDMIPRILWALKAKIMWTDSTPSYITPKRVTHILRLISHLLRNSGSDSLQELLSFHLSSKMAGNEKLVIIRVPVLLLRGSHLNGG